MTLTDVFNENADLKEKLEKSERYVQYYQMLGAAVAVICFFLGIFFIDKVNGDRIDKLASEYEIRKEYYESESQRLNEQSNEAQYKETEKKLELCENLYKRQSLELKYTRIEAEMAKAAHIKAHEASIKMYKEVYKEVSRITKTYNHSGNK